MTSLIDKLRLASAESDPTKVAKARKEAGLHVQGDSDREVASDPQAKTSEDLITVVFKKSWRRWYKGDRAGFSKKVADSLVKAGVAHYADTFLKKVASAIKTVTRGKGKRDPTPAQQAAAEAVAAANAAAEAEAEADAEEADAIAAGEAKAAADAAAQEEAEAIAAAEEKAAADAAAQGVSGEGQSDETDEGTSDTGDDAQGDASASGDDSDEGPGDDGAADDRAQLEALIVPDLRKLAEQSGIEGAQSMNKGPLVEALLAVAGSEGPPTE